MISFQVKNFIKPIFFIFFIFFCSINLSASIKKSYYDEELNYQLDKLKLCNIDLNLNSNYSSFLSPVINAINSLPYEKLSYQCQINIDETLYLIKNELSGFHNKIGFSSKRQDLFFQDLSQRSYDEELLYFSFENTFDNFAYKISLNKINGKNQNDFSLDESYVTFLNNNTVFSLGKTSRWWGSSVNTSLILSNSARPSPGLSISSLNSIQMPFLSNVNYEIFINKLENNRFTPRPYLFGARVKIDPIKNLSISLYRTAQLGGEGRPFNFKVFTDMLLGIDNYKAGDNEDEPGNQLAGIDMKYDIPSINDLSLYGQIVGEDESGYLPSRTFYMIGIEFKPKRPYKEKLNIEFFDTGSKIPNYTYSHFIYKSGYSYKNYPIGASIGSDSKAVFLNYYRDISNDMQLKSRLIYGDINYNINKLFKIDKYLEDLKIFELSLQRQSLFIDRLSTSIIFHFNDNNDGYENFGASINLEYIW